MSIRQDLLHADVLVIGSGLAGTWAGLAAAREGVQVVLVDKGWCGTSGVTASAGPGHWWVPPVAEQREAAVERRAAAGMGLADPRWMHRVLDMTWRHLPTLATHYEFPENESGQTQCRALRGPEYLRAMRSLVLEAGVTILDHSPALELLLHGDGSVAGASGIRRQQAHSPWTVRAGAVVLASGGCAFRSKLLGADNNTGDGLLMAAEAGATLSGMEFTNYYTVAPVGSSMTRSMSYVFASYYDAAGHELPIPAGPGANAALGRALLQGPVWCSLARMPLDIRARLPQISPNVMLPFVRRGIDPFTQRFEVTLRGEGTVRGIGGLRIASDDCETDVRGLFAAGDVATRELVAGAISGGGAQNSAWGLASGLWAGRAAAKHARNQGLRLTAPAEAIGGAGLRPRAAPSALDLQAVVRAVQAPMLALDQNMFRNAAGLQRATLDLDAHWTALRDHGQSAGPDTDTGAGTLRLREAAAMLACARWGVRSALARTESRGMFQRSDTPETDPSQARRRLSGGLDRVWTRAEAALEPNEMAA